MSKISANRNLKNALLIHVTYKVEKYIKKFTVLIYLSIKVYATHKNVYATHKNVNKYKLLKRHVCRKNMKTSVLKNLFKRDKRKFNYR